MPKVDVNENGFTPLDDGIWMSKSTTVNKNGFTPFADCVCQSLLQSTRMGSNLLLMGDVKVYYSQQEWVYILCWLCMSKSTTVHENGFKPFANGGCQSLLQSTRMDLHPLLMVDVKVYNSQREYIITFAESIYIYKFNECIP